MLEITNRPKDRVKKRDKEWKEAYVKYVSSRAAQFHNKEWKIRERNYRYLQSELNQAEFQRYCDAMGVDTSMGRDYVQAFNVMSVIIEKLLGDEILRNFEYTVVDQSPENTNEFLRKEQSEYAMYIAARLTTVLEAHQMMIQELQEREMKGVEQMTPQQQQEYIEKTKEKLMKRYDFIANPETIRDRYKDKMAEKEIAMHHLVKQLERLEDVEHKKNMGFKHLLTSSLEAVRVEYFDGKPHIEVLNSLGVIYNKSSEERWIQKGDYAAYRSMMTASDIKRRYNLNKKQIKLMEEVGRNVDGFSDPLMSRDGRGSTKWADKMRKSPGTFMNQGVAHSGQYGHSNLETDYMFTVTDCYWVTERYVGVYTYFDEFGEEQAEFRDESFKAPNFAIKVVEEDEFGNDITYYEWEDETGLHRLQNLWIPEVWRGTDIDGKMWVDIRPMPESFQPTVANMYEVNLPIFGYVDNTVNGGSISVVDRMMPWYKMYLIFMSRLLNRVAKDHGSFTALNSLFFDSDKTPLQKLMHDIVRGGVAFTSDKINSDVIPNMASMKAGEKIDLGSMQDIQSYVELADFAERQMFKAAGVAPQALGQTSRGSNASDNERDVMMTQINTERLFVVHEQLWEKVMWQATVLLGQSAASNHPIIREVLSDGGVAVIDTSQITPDSQFRFQLVNESANRKMRQVSESHLLALLQNDKISLSTLLRLMRKGGADAELIQDIESVERELQERDVRLQEMQQKQQQAQQEAERVKQAEEHARELEKLQMELESKEYIAQLGTINGASDADGIDDDVETMIKLRDENRKNQELELKRQELELKKRQAAQKKQ